MQHAGRAAELRLARELASMLEPERVRHRVAVARVRPPATDAGDLPWTRGCQQLRGAAFTQWAVRRADHGDRPVAAREVRRHQHELRQPASSRKRGVRTRPVLDPHGYSLSAPADLSLRSVQGGAGEAIEHGAWRRRCPARPQIEARVPASLHEPGCVVVARNAISRNDCHAVQPRRLEARDGRRRRDERRDHGRYTRSVSGQVR
jgi:hypothetical protein